MQRKIKFRARWKDTGKVIPDFMDQYVCDAINDECFIVEQYIGRKDKNGKEIYEGDMVRYNRLGEGIKTGVVNYEQEACAFFFGTDEIGDNLIDIEIISR